MSLLLILAMKDNRSEAKNYWICINSNYNLILVPFVTHTTVYAVINIGATSVKFMWGGGYHGFSYVNT